MNGESWKLLILPLLLIPSSSGCRDTQADFRSYVEQKFDIELDSSYVLTVHTREHVYNYLTNELFYGNAKAQQELNRCKWRTGSELFVDSVYARDSAGELHGFFVDFSGDSLGGYEAGFFYHGRFDSIVVLAGCMGDIKIRRYEKGAAHGIWEYIDADGKKYYHKKFERGNPVDTSYEWYDNGNVMARRYYENDTIVWEKCYEEDGTTEMECDF